MNIVAPLLKIMESSALMVVITDHYYKLTDAIPNNVINSNALLHIFFEHWVVSYVIPSKLLTDHGPQLLLKLFEAVYSTPGLITITTTENCLHTSGQTEHFSSTPILRFRPMCQSTRQTGTHTCYR